MSSPVSPQLSFNAGADDDDDGDDDVGLTCDELPVLGGRDDNFDGDDDAHRHHRFDDDVESIGASSMSASSGLQRYRRVDCMRCVDDALGRCCPSSSSSSSSSLTVTIIGWLCAAALLVVAAALGVVVVHLQHKLMSSSSSSSSFADPPTVVLVSIDGCRADYLTHDVTPNLLALAAAGARSPIEPVFPSKTFPNHYSIATGLYAESHGIVSNHFFSPRLNASFNAFEPALAAQPRWWLGEPFWNAVERAGQRAACCFWPGSDVAIGGRRPTWWLEYNASMPYAERVTTVLDWLRLPSPSPPHRRPTFVTLYFEGVDHAGHAVGPDVHASAEHDDDDHGNDGGRASPPRAPPSLRPGIVAALRDVDAAIGTLVRGVRDGLALRNVTFIVVADHGMTDVSRTRVVDLTPNASRAAAWHALVERVDDFSPVLAVQPRANVTAAALAAFINASSAHVRAWPKHELPERLHYALSERIPDVVGVADVGWTIGTGAASLDAMFHYNPAGNHGFDNCARDMRGIFIANGPRIVQQPSEPTSTTSSSPLASERDASASWHAPPLPNVHLVELMAELLSIAAPPNNGSLAATQHLLRANGAG